MIIMDFKREKNTDTAGEKGYDGGKDIRDKAPYRSRYQGLALCGSGKDGRGE
jgi:hypothetical protein